MRTGVLGKSLFFPVNFAGNLKLLKKKSLKMGGGTGFKSNINNKGTLITDENI